MASNSIRYDEPSNLKQKAAAVGHVTTEMGDLVGGESLWNGEYVTHGGLLPQQYDISPTIEEMYSYSQSMRIPHLSSSSQDTFKVNSAFTRYKKERGTGFQLSRKSSMKQKSIKRCFDFLRRIHENRRENSRWEVHVEESYTSTHRIAERNRRIKLGEQFLALRSLLADNYKKGDKHSILSNAVVELNQQKLRITELEKHNKTLMDEVTQQICEGYSSLSRGNVEDLGKHPLMSSICEEAVVVIEGSEIADEVIMNVTLKNIGPNYKYMDAIVTLVKCLKEMEVGIGRIQCRELDSRNPVIQVAIQRQT
ncbi:hypothetical protein SUGI_0062100 [Cryptomeria japonica]|uniref:uncharacterized protein LOC131856099 n=1 Tax=Cryptomeria japonica TaxID=3369 RepID=UPI002408C345|nr:uncharacterized protein LOC131856099 [Cryptomeria japonica]GLJ07222.1 hypothetical protein SUGI_0062100 [Cryptomeria japonica]